MTATAKKIAPSPSTIAEETAPVGRCKPSKLRLLYRLVGRKMLLLLLAAVLAGVSTFVVEIAFAYGLQAFLVTLGAAKLETFRVIKLFPLDRMEYLIAYLAIVGILRAFLTWFNHVLQKLVLTAFQFEQRSRVVHWALHGKNVSSVEFTAIFNECISLAAITMMYLQSVCVNLTTTFLLGLALLNASGRLTVVSVVLLAIIAFPVHRMNRISKAAGEGLKTEWEKVNRRLIMSIRNLLLVRVFGIQHEEERLSVANLNGYRKHYFTYSNVEAVQAVIPQLCGVGLVCLFASFGRSWSELSGGSLVAYFYLLIRFLQNVSAAMSNLSSIAFTWPRLNELAQWRAMRDMDEPARSRRKGTKETPTVSIVDPIGWKLSHVHFSYSSNQSAMFDDLSLSIAPGSAAVIIGPSGVGKSTLLKLLLGDIVPTAGSVQVLLGGQGYRVREVECELLEHIGYVSADSFIIEGTIYDNLVYGLRTTPSASEIDDVLDKAECGFVRAFPEWRRHRISEHGEGLSSGQKQRLSLARALLRKPKALVLDEFTSNLDNETEKKLVATLSKLKGDLTIIAVTHRHELLQIADQQIRLGTADP